MSIKGCEPNKTVSIKYNAIENLKKIDVFVGTKIARTLQGSIYRGTLKKDNNTLVDVVIKRANVNLIRNNLACLDNNMIPISEDIIKETKIMKHIQSLNPPKGFLKVFKIMNDGYNYFLIMEYGGKSLFDHVKKYHELIELNKLSLDEWKNHVKIIFNQLVNMIYFLHNKARICHMDISLENLLIKGCVFNNGKFNSHGQVFFCDFGLSEYFGKIDSQFKCTKYVGKIVYQAPEVFSRKIAFDARKADIWSLGICLFEAQFGLAPLNEPSMNDKYFKNIINGHLSTMIYQNGKTNHISKSMLNILNHILTVHNHRWNVDTIKKYMLSNKK